ncbi:MAG: DUF6326 family protein [Acidimicrobiales bacterium]
MLNSPVDIRLRISALWIAMLFIFAYVDLFSLYRPDVRADLANNRLAGFEIGQPFLLAVTVFVIIPSLMVYLSLVVGRELNRIANMVVAGTYALATIGSAIGEWNYYVAGSAVEAVLLALVVRHAWSWPEPLAAE